jgi:hypothetical protein
MQVRAVQLDGTRADQTREQSGCRSGQGGRQNGAPAEYQPKRHSNNGS